jgi:retron-type reverse transcriptase
VISPLLSNIYLHYALDLWANRWRQRKATGDMIIVRYADDFYQPAEWLTLRGFPNHRRSD